MKQKLALAFGLAAIIIGMTYGARSLRADDSHKVMMCHVTGNSTKAHVINIDWSAVQTHLAHGDTIIDPTQAQGLKAGDPCDPTMFLK